MQVASLDTGIFSFVGLIYFHKFYFQNHTKQHEQHFFGLCHYREADFLEVLKTVNIVLLVTTQSVEIIALNKF